MIKVLSLMYNTSQVFISDFISYSRLLSVPVNLTPLAAVTHIQLKVMTDISPNDLFLTQALILLYYLRSQFLLL